jgi:hypothetical protein
METHGRQALSRFPGDLRVLPHGLSWTNRECQICAGCAQDKGPLSMPPLHPGAWPAGQYSSPYARPNVASPSESDGLLRAESESASVRVVSLTSAPASSSCACAANCMTHDVHGRVDGVVSCQLLVLRQCLCKERQPPRPPSAVNDPSA